MILTIMTASQRNERILKRVVQLAENIAQPLGLTVLDVQLGQQGQVKSLEVCIMRQGGAIGFSDCEQVSKQLGSLLEEESLEFEPLIQGHYLLEVVSPGIERQLVSARDFQLFAGQRIRVRAKENIGKLGAEFTCTLLAGDEASLKVSAAEPLLNPRPKIAKSKELKQIKNQTSNTEQTLLAQEDVLKLDLTKVFKINLYGNDLLKEGKAARSRPQ